MKHMNDPDSIRGPVPEARNPSETQLITKKENISTPWLGKTNKYGMETYQRRKGEAQSLAGCKNGAILHVNNWLIHRSEGEQIWGLWLSIQKEKGFKTCSRI